MKVIRVLNPSGLRAITKRKGKTMATKRRRRRRRTNASVGHPRRVAAKAVNPRRRRRRRRNPTTIVTRATRRTINPRRRRHTRRHARRGNPSGIRVGEMAKKAIYGAGGAILTRAGASLIEGFIPSQFATSPLARPITQAAIAVIGVRWVGNKFLGAAQADIMMIGGLISAGLAAFDAYLPNAQMQVQNIFRPILPGVQAQVPAAAAAALAGGYADVYDVPQSALMGFRGLGDVEDVPMGIFS